MITRRAMVEADISQVASLISRAWVENGAGAEMHVGDLYWALFHKRRDIADSSAQLWTRGDGSVLAFLMRSQSGWCDLVTEPGIEPKDILQQVVEVAESPGDFTGKRPPARIGRRFGEAETASFLRNAGYRRMNFGYLTLETSLARKGAGNVPDGFVVKSMEESTASDEAREAAWQSAFPGDVRYASDIESLGRAPGYESELDFVCESEEGDLAAFCTVWFDSETRSGLFEPVGTVTGFQRRGLGAAMIGEALARLERFGAEKAYVRVHSENERAIAFYLSCGFQTACSTFGFEKATVIEE